MKRSIASVLVIWLALSVGGQYSYADMMDLPPPRPKGVEERQITDDYPTYAIAAGVVAVALTVSLIALRRIRKRNGQ